MAVMAVRLPPSLRHELTAAAERRGLDTSTAIREALALWLNKDTAA
jgi:predicted DNA-binding protein